MGPAEDKPLDDLVVFSHDVLHRDVEVGEALPIGQAQVIGPLLTRLLAPQLGIGLLMVDAVRGEELVKHPYVAAQPKFAQNAVDDCLVLIERHDGNLLLRVNTGK
jgi:hypothetical protein